MLEDGRIVHFRLWPGIDFGAKIGRWVTVSGGEVLQRVPPGRLLNWCGDSQSESLAIPDTQTNKETIRMKLRSMLLPLAAALTLTASPLMAQEKRTVIGAETAKKMAAACEALAK